MPGISKKKDLSTPEKSNAMYVHVRIGSFFVLVMGVLCWGLAMTKVQFADMLA